MSGISDKKVLVVEDEEMNRILLTRYLSKLNIEADLCINGQEALLKLEHTKYDLIFMDLEMPVMNGYDAMTELRKSNYKSKNSNILAFTGQGHAELIEKAKVAGANDFIAKPIDFQDLTNKITKYLTNEDKDELIPSSNSKKQNYFSHIDLTYLINSAHGDKTFIEKMLNSYKNNTLDYLNDMLLLYEQNDLEGLRVLAHKYKATVLITGVKELSSIIEELESTIVNQLFTENIPFYLDQIIDISHKARLEVIEALQKKLF